MKKIFLSLAAISALIIQTGCNDKKEEQKPAQELSQNVKSSTEEVAKKINTIVDNVATKVDEHINTAANQVEPMINSAVDSISDTTKSVANNLKESTNEVANTIKESTDSAAKAITDGIDKVSSSVENVLKTDAATLFKKCIACHGKNAEKLAPGAEVVINTLSESEIYEALSGYKAGTFGGKSQKTMQLQVKNLNDEDFKALAKYIKTL
ncbi:MULTISPECIES: c-type cytochrome [unclassified Campylobacter]|uniref:c-type cytochrome n=1 Tax=unclassified Campylobacter TaxID=2593542 RepID=UPI001EFA58E4|nr:c-type cytochrome [Campylobacter sp. RM12651]ULO02563.1 cytochrome c [Campylobacter sp. RM12651]